jgi:DNA-binding transcriptional ArsR family regulator
MADAGVPARWRVTRAVRGSTLPAPAKLIMLVLADVADVGTAEIPPNRTPSLTVLARETGLGRSTVTTHLRALEAAGWIVRTKPTTAEALGQYERTRYQLRVPASEPALADDLVPEPVEASAATDIPSVTPDLPSAADDHPSAGAEHRDRSSTDKNQIEKTSTSVAVPPRADVEKICRHLADRIEDNGSKRPNITKKWRDEARRLIDLDGRTVDQVIKAIDWCQSDTFWKANILSMPTLREQYDRLRLAAQGRNGNGHRTSTTDQRVAAALALADQLDQESA